MRKGITIHHYMIHDPNDDRRRVKEGVFLGHKKRIISPNDIRTTICYVPTIILEKITLHLLRVVTESLKKKPV